MRFVMNSGTWPAALLLTALLLASPLTAHAERLALVVGNAAYETLPALGTPGNDAGAMAAKLGELGFGVTLLQDVTRDGLRAAIETFADQAKDADSVLFFYAGHAFQLEEVNYLVPVRARLDSRDSLEAEALNLYGILARLQESNRQTLLFLDAGRPDLLAGAVRGTETPVDGLARMQTGVGTFAAFATEPGAVIFDGVSGRNVSPFTEALLNHMGAEGISVSDMMVRVRHEVEINTLRKQTPWNQSSLRDQFYFVPEFEQKQELSNADFELLAKLSPENLERMLEVLRLEGFSQKSLDDARAAILIARENFEKAKESPVTIGEPGSATTESEPEEPADEPIIMASAEVPETADVSHSEITEETTSIYALLDAPAAEEEEDQPVIRLNSVLEDRVRIEGTRVQPDTEENKALLESIDPRLVEPDAPELSGKALARATQTELRRLGCYRMKVDGDWGKGSKTALTSYFLARGVIPDNLSLSPELLDRLQGEPRVICKIRVATVGKDTGKSTPPTQTGSAGNAAQKEKTREEIKMTIGGFN